MNNYIRHYFPGGNTPLGFFSYYENILFQEEAKRIYCIKGGPGTGKSTLMKNISNYFKEQGESIDHLWCSSDPDSLDGIVFRNKKIAIIDGTYPHNVDPLNPGAVDEIINLGKCWDIDGIKENRDSIITTGKVISQAFRFSYQYLKSARSKYDLMAQLLNNSIDKSIYANIMSMINDLPEKNNNNGIVKRFFGSAITPLGVKNHIYSLADELDRVILIDTPVGIDITKVFNDVLSRLIDKGYDTEVFYCPMYPDNKIEHIVSKDAGIGIMTSNYYHDIDIDLKDDIRISILLEFHDTFSKSEYERAKSLAHEDICLSIDMLKRAKSYHDRLERFYIDHMDFDKINRITNGIINEIKNI